MGGGTEGRRGRGRGWGQDGEPLALPVRFSKLDKHYLSVQANKLALALGLHGTYFNKMRPDAIHARTFNSVLFNS